MLVINQRCQPCGFPANLGLFFVELRVFLMNCGLLVFRLVLIEICLFFGLVFMQISALWIAFFQILWHFFCFNLLLKKIWACFCENMLVLGL